LSTYLGDLEAFARSMEIRVPRKTRSVKTLQHVSRLPDS
jgi:hypothetical protein